MSEQQRDDISEHERELRRVASMLASKDVEKGASFEIDGALVEYHENARWVIVDDGEVIEVVIGEKFRSALNLLNHIRAAIEWSRNDRGDDSDSPPATGVFQ